MDDDLLDQAFAAGAMHVNIMRFRDEYEVRLSAFRDLESEDGVEHTEHAGVVGRGRTPALALREAVAKLRPTPAIEVREIRVVNGRKVVPLALAESTTRIKGLRAPDVEVVDEVSGKSPAGSEPEAAEAG